jgi:hypothetical protein
MREQKLPAHANISINQKLESDITTILERLQQVLIKLDGQSNNDEQPNLPLLPLDPTFSIPYLLYNGNRKDRQSNTSPTTHVDGNPSKDHISDPIHHGNDINRGTDTMSPPTNTQTTSNKRVTFNDDTTLIERVKGRNRKKTQHYLSSVNAVKNNNKSHWTENVVDNSFTPLIGTYSYKSTKSGPFTSQWAQAEADEIRRLVSTTNTMKFIRHSDKPYNRKASYYNPQPRIKIKDGKYEFRIRGTYGGNLSDYDGDVSAYTADTSSVKILLNSVVSTDKAKFATLDISDFYLYTKLENSEYMRIHRRLIPQQIIDEYKLHKLFIDDHVMVEVTGGMYGLKQAGLIAQHELKTHLAKHGYIECKNTSCMFRHKTRNIAFVLVVDDFGIKYVSESDLSDLVRVLQLKYSLTLDMSGTTYLGLKINHDENEHTISISLPGYIERTLLSLNVIKSEKPVHNPVKYIPPVYGSNLTQQSYVDTSPRLDALQTKRIERIVGKLLYYARIIDSTMLVAVTKLASQQAAPTIETLEAAELLLQYAAHHPDAEVVFKRSNMQLEISSDASYLSERKSRSRVGGIAYLKTNELHTGDNLILPNGPIDITCSILGPVVTSAMEAEYGALYVNARKAKELVQTLEDLGHPQGPVTIYADNKPAINVANGNAKQKRSKAIDMRFNWIKDRIKNKEFNILWDKGSKNLADFVTKAHPTKHFLNVRKLFVKDTKDNDRPTSHQHRQEERRLKYLTKKPSMD